MKRSEIFHWIFGCFLLKLPRYSLTLLLGVVLLLDLAGATPPTRGLEIGQKAGTTQQGGDSATAEQTFQEGLQFYKQGTPESLRKAIVKWLEALQLFERLNDKANQALTLTGIGKVYSNLGDLQKALTYYNQALPLFHALGDKSGEARTLNNIGSVYSDSGDLQKALTYYNQALPLFRAVGNKSGEGTTLNNIGLVYSNLGDNQKALTYYNQALPLIRAAGDKSDEATTLNNIGGVHSDLGDLQKALTYYNQALPLRRAVGDKSGEAATLNNIGSVYSNLGDNQKALTHYNQALPLFRAVGNKSGEAATLNNIGRVYADLGDLQKALTYYNQALALFRTVGNKSGEATTLNNIGAVYLNLGDLQKALTYYNQVLALIRTVGDKSGEATTLNNIGRVYSDLGEKQKALTYYNQVLALIRAVGDNSREAGTLNNIGKVYSDLGEKQKALTYYNQALPLFRAVGNKSGEATTLNNIGAVYSNLGDTQKALTYYNQALPLYRAVGDKSGEATTLNNIGTVYNDLGEKQKALTYLNQVLPLYRAAGDKSGEATTLNNIGRVYADLGDLQKALTYYNQALPLRRAVGDKSGEATTLGNIALLERNQGDLERSLKQIKAAIQISEELRTKVVNKDLQSSYFASAQRYYKFYIDLLMQLHKKYPLSGYDALALQISERSRARGLIELLTEAHADIRKGVDPKLLAIEQQLQQKIDSTTRQLQELSSKPNTEAAIAKLKLELENLLSQQQELQTKIRLTSPKYAAIKYPQALNLEQIQQQLDSDTLLLEYSLGKEHSYLWAVTPNSIDTYQLPDKKQIETAAENFRQNIKLPYSSPDLNKLSQIILAPVASKLGKKRLVIVADGALQTIPFAALSDITTNNKASGNIQYQPLIVNHQIVNLPSLTTIATQRKELMGRKSAPKTLAILADPVFEANDTRITGKPEPPPVSNLVIPAEIQQAEIKRAARSFGLGRLEGTRKEANAILKLVNQTDNLQAFDFDANYNWATSKQLSQYRFLHFATHGFADPEHPELSRIVLSLFDQKGSPTPRGYLQLGDIFNLDYPADLVVLSACDTGIGKNVEGEGLIGLTRGLMYAGSQRVAVSLWKVNDDATAKLMQEFYFQMLQLHQSPSVALREAQLKLLRDPNLNKPLYWAAFTLQGEWR
ncbi:CHAT domain-containing tetratricopeptide repeat protein [Aetokthonos hydrillicola]|uniref:CHAT domain-containing tetratricopeptide repeat protein n=1 Tax=Aetokthonos hydrillicola TaxID=1550245 RepID=UPI001ABAD57F|nr:CHAT domain-containing tetratricopeptide repeat protein [Aetokthonos hydrillicola]MBO3457864.1 tetratricopeptide repeat protein [Aetokthonos hydrillicola CCALA 1050]